MKEKNQPGNYPAQTLKVAAYIRVSTYKDEQEDSYELQERYFASLLEANPTWVSAGVYSDYAMSATSTGKRTGFKRLMRHCQEGKIDRIISKSISRFARNTRDFLMAIRILNESGVTIFFEKENLDTADEKNEFILTTLGALAQEESRSISENIRWGFQKRFPMGEARNIDIYGFCYAEGEEEYSITESGYRFRNLEIVEAEAEIVRRIFREVAAGNSYIGIARELNMDNIPAPGEKEIGWTGEQVREVVHKERYVGDMLLQKAFVTNFLTHKEQKNTGELPKYYVKDHHRAIVDRELFQNAQEMIDSKRKRINKGDSRKRYPLSGLLICASCGHHFHTYNRKCYPIWECGTVRLHNGKGACSMPHVYESQIINMFKKALVKRFHLAAEKKGIIGQMIREMEAVHEGDMAECERLELMRELARLKGENDERGAVDLMEKINHREEYYMRLETEYEVREKCIRWLKTLSEGAEGVAELLIGIKSEHIRGFALKIMVYSPVKYRVTWFDDSETDITMDSVIEDHRFR